MPELPDLEVIREHLAQHLTGVAIASAEVRRPIVVRNLLGGDLAQKLACRVFCGVQRQGKFLLFPLDDDTSLVIHPMDAGRLRYGEPLARHRKRDALVLRLGDGQELRYNDRMDKGKVYLSDDLSQIPVLNTLGPEAIDPALTLELFCERIQNLGGDIKKVLTTQTFVAGIGSAYADEILWNAQVYPFRRRSSLDDEEFERIYSAVQTVLRGAIETLRERRSYTSQREVRDFLAMRGDPNKACPRCGGSISEVRRDRRPTRFCRTCQPGLLVRR